jgi:hypothetical protein
MYEFDCRANYENLIANTSSDIISAQPVYYYSAKISKNVKSKDAVLYITPYDLSCYYKFNQPKYSENLLEEFNPVDYPDKSPIFKEFHVDIYERFKNFVNKPDIFTHRGFLTKIGMILYLLFSICFCEASIANSIKETDGKKNIKNDSFTFDAYMHDGICFFSLNSEVETFDKFNYLGFGYKINNFFFFQS